VASSRKQGGQPVPPPAEDAHKIGYARVSMADQNPQLQIDALIRAGVNELDIYVEKVSGAATKRPQFEAMLKDVREGDVVIVWKLDRLGRDNISLHRTAEIIQEKGAHLRLLDNSGLDTTTAAGRMMFAMLAAMAQFERDVNHERTLAGLQAARERGRIGGRRSQFTDEQILTAAKFGTKPGARKLGMSVSGFVKAVERVKAAKERGDAEG
jgi:DNA invertase Pin-like site-specific DNA recombinase